MKQEIRAGNPGAISAPLLDRLIQNVQDGKQSILFLNRRGNSRCLVCVECGEAPGCPRCSVSLTYHSANNRLMCHYCGHSQAVPARCPSCGGALKSVGFGTQRVEQELHELLPDVPVLRMDADTVSASNDHEAILSRFVREKIPILLGTQMVAKGLDFENVTLVGVLDADLSLYFGSFRAAETTFSLVTQVVGRAGRGKSAGTALIQTMTPEHPVLRLAARQDYDAFYDMEIQLRTLRRFPPLRDVFTVTAACLHEDRLIRSAATLRQAIAGNLAAMGLTDADLFPAGTVTLNGYKVYGEERVRAVSYAASVAKAAGSSLAPLLDRQLTAEGGYPMRVDELRYCEEGGVEAAIRGETVLMGSAYFMKKRRVPLPRDLKLQTGLFLAVDGVLTAVFAVKYQPSRNAEWALRAMRRSRITPVLAVRSSNVTPGLIKRKFGVDAKVVYPDVSTRLALAQLASQQGDAPNVIVCREGLLPLAESVVGSRRMVRAVRTATVLSYIGSLCGILLAYYLTSAGDFTVLTPVAMVLFLLLWLLPTLLIAGLVRHF